MDNVSCSTSWCPHFGGQFRVLRHLIVEGDLSAYGLVNAVTHFSQDVEGCVSATQLKALGGKLIELALGDWQELANAA